MEKIKEISDLTFCSNGEYCFEKPNNFSVFIKNFDKIELSSKILVCFTAAVANRDKKSGPFYSGLGLAEKLKIPTISISDYLVTNNNLLSLAWYAGDDKNTEFQDSIAQFLNNLSLHYKKDLILLGGSGGGFASLAIATKLKVKATVIAMNPQTSISKYFKNSVKQYLDTAFPNEKNILIEDSETFLKKKNIISNLCEFEYQDNINIIFLQNITDDHHIVRHCSNFFSKKDLFPIGDNSFISKNNIGLYFGMWGNGHIPPNALIILEIIKLINSNTSIIKILRYLENGLSNLNENKKLGTFLTEYDYKLQVQITEKEDFIVPHIKLYYRGALIKTPIDIKYAVYILNQKNEIVERKNYSETLPQIKSNDEKIKLKVFVRDRMGRKITGISKIF